MNNYLMQQAADVLLVVGDVVELTQTRRSLLQAKVRNRLHCTDKLTRRRGRALLDRECSALYVDAGANSGCVSSLKGASLARVPATEFVNLSALSRRFDVGMRFIH